MMRAKEFVHLHLHSEYSLLDGCLRIPEAVEAAKEMGMPALALTDHGAMHGVVPFHQAAVEQGLKPIIGCEIYLAPRSMEERTPKVDDDICHLTLLVVNRAGYHNLIKLVSEAWLRGFYRKPRADLDCLARYADGLICLSGCLQGPVAQAVLRDQPDKAARAAQDLAEIFRDGRFYIELMDHGLEDQARANPQLVALAKRLNLPVVATNDVHYLRQEDHEVQRILLCVQTKKTVAEGGGLGFDVPLFYLRSPEEMCQVFAELPEALSNTLAIAESCETDLWESEDLILPNFNLPAGVDESEYLHNLCMQGLEEQGLANDEQARARMEYELSVLSEKRYSGYFLVVHDFARYAKERGIMVGARGSAAGSLVAYLLGITHLNPLPYGLLFERFLNPERKSPPDIDLDIPDNRREEMIRYAKERYGEENVAQIVTFGTLAARAAVRDAGRALGMSYAEVDAIAKLVPANQPLGEARETVLELADAYRRDERVRRLIDTSIGLEGLARHASTHAAGLVITNKPLTEYLPVQRSSQGDTVTTQYDQYALEHLGLTKVDMLGLATLNTIHQALDEIQRRRGERLDLYSIPLDDSKTFDMLCRAEATGVFQLESPGMRELLRSIGPRSLGDLMHIIALFRPGPMGRLDVFVQRRQGQEPVEYLHPALEPVLAETYGIMLYQEQVMSIANIIAGFTMGQAEMLMKAMSKKRPEVMQEMRGRFMEGAARNGVREETASQLYDRMSHFGAYGFNKSHSAVYALVSYYTAYLKAYYPAEYMAALITCEHDREKSAQYVEEARRLGLRVALPDLNRSQEGFSVEDGSTIRFGLGAIKGIGKNVVQGIIEARAAGPFAGMFDVCERVPLGLVTRSTLELLVQAGAFDSFGTRAAHLAALPRAVECGKRTHDQAANGQASLFGQAAAAQPTVEDLPELSAKELLDFEKELLGICLSGSAESLFPEDWRELCTHSAADLGALRQSTQCALTGRVTQVRSHTARNNQPMMFFTLEDPTGPVDVVLFPDPFKRYGTAVVRDRLVVVAGRSQPPEEGEGRGGRAAMPKLIADRVLPYEQAKADRSYMPRKNGDSSQRTVTSRGHLQIVTSAVALHEGLLLDLRDALETCPGKTPVVLRVRFGDGRERRISLGAGCRVACSEELQQQLAGLFGENAVALAGQ